MAANAPASKPLTLTRRQWLVLYACDAGTPSTADVHGRIRTMFRLAGVEHGQPAYWWPHEDQIVTIAKQLKRKGLVNIHGVKYGPKCYSLTLRGKAVIAVDGRVDVETINRPSRLLPAPTGRRA